jgi:hypothetical protein
MNSDRVVMAIAAVVLVVATATAGWLAAGIQRERRELELVVSRAGTEGMPPHVAIATAALGTFRGLAVDILWARADHLQTEGEYFEAQTLSQWISASHSSNAGGRTARSSELSDEPKHRETEVSPPKWTTW